MQVQIRPWGNSQGVRFTKEFLNSDFTMPLWLAWTMSFFAGSGLAYWALYLIGKPFGVEYVWMPKTWISE